MAAWNAYGATLPKTGMNALTSIYKKKQAQPQINSNYGQFNAEANPVYQQMKSNIMSGATRQGMNALATYSGGQTPDSAARVGSQQVYMDSISKLNDYIPQFEQTNYNRGQDTLNRQDDINAQLGYANPYGGKPVNPQTTQYFGNLQAEINRRKATPDTADDALNPDLEAARVNKIFGDVGLLQKYGSPYRTQEAQSIDLQNQYQGMQNKYYPQMQESNLQSQNLQNKYYSPQAEASLAQTKAQTSNIYADNARQNQSSSKYERIGPLYSQMMQSGDPSSWLAKNASIMTGDELDALAGFVPKQSYEGLTYKDYTSRGYDMMETKDEYGKVNKNQNQLNTYDWIKTLPISGEEKARLASDLGINKDLVTNPWLGR